MALRAIQTRAQPAPPDPPWLTAFLVALKRADLAPATRRGYGYDLRHFLAWRASVQTEDFTLERLGEYDLIAYRQHLLAAGRRPATVNRRLNALRRLCRWAHSVGNLRADVAHGLRPVRVVRNRQPAGLTDAEAHALLRAAGASTHGLAGRNYALVQLMLQAGLRVGEVAALRVEDVTLHERSGSVRIRAGKGMKAREVPLNATARRALQRYLEGGRVLTAGEPLFLSSRGTAMPVRSIQAAIASLVRRARIKRIAASAHSLRHTFALGYLRDNPGKLVELAGLLGHDSLDTTAVYTRPSEDDLAADLERSHLNVDR
ncbi:MAG: tyrosine-type recombinase/integrase [Steroidobacteraceae bacterium]